MKAELWRERFLEYFQKIKVGHMAPERDIIQTMQTAVMEHLYLQILSTAPQHSNNLQNGENTLNQDHHYK